MDVHAGQANLQGELDLICSSIQGIVHRLATASHQVEDDVIFKVAQTTDIPRIKAISTPGSAQPVEDAIEDAFTVFDYRVRVNHPKFFAFVPGPAHPFSWLGDCLTSAFNSFAGSKLQGSGVAIVEKTLISWLASKVGLPDTAGGLFVSGGSMANLTGMALARDSILPPGKEQIGVAYLSEQTHYSVAKALRTIGFRRHQIRLIKSDDKYRMIPEELSKTIKSDREAGLIPFAVVGTCGTTNTGSIDPLAELAEICKTESIWFHVDGAYGASAVLSNTRSDVLNGLHLADSISWDAHKWLFQTYACSLILVKDRKHLVESFANDGDYLRDALEDEEIPNFWNFGVELTRPARAMKLWFTLRVLGVESVGNMIDQGFLLAERAQGELLKLPNWEIASPASLAIVTFRYAPPGKTQEELNALNMAISRDLVMDNVAGILTTKLNEKVVMRICSISPLLTVQGMAEVIGEVNQRAKKHVEQA